MRSRLLAAAVLPAFLAAVLCGTSARAAVPPSPAVPEGLGVNIHFTDPKPGEMKMLAEGGFGIVRMDFGWNGTEREAGKYDFSAYERLLAALQMHGIKALFILDYSNKLYDGGLSPCSDEGRKAFAKWSAAAAVHFKGRGILWEMYNEPNIQFWNPKPKVEDYILLAMEVGKALRAAAPDEAYIGPATSELDFTFLEACFKAGLLEYWSAVSVHPYRQKPPETAAEDYAKLRRMIDQYAPKGKYIPIYSGEWGYSCAWKNFDDERQGKYLPRQWLTNLASDVPVSIWYDWHDDGKDPKEAEHHFGTVANAYFSGRDPVYDAKPSYKAARTLVAELKGFSFSKRLVVGADDDYVLLFAKGDEVRLAAWTTAKEPHTVTIPASPGRFKVTGHTGEAFAAVAADKEGLKVALTDAPQYLAPEIPNDLLRLAAAWERAPLEIAGRGGEDRAISLAIKNPLARPVRIRASRDKAFIDVAPGATVVLPTTFAATRTDASQKVCPKLVEESLGTVGQSSVFLPTNPLRIALLPPGKDGMSVQVENPSGEVFKGKVTLSDLAGLRPQSASMPLEFRTGEWQKSVRFALLEPVVKEYQLGVDVIAGKDTLVAELLPARLTPVADFSRYTSETLAAAWQIVPDGDAKVASTQTISLAAPPDGPPAPGVACLKIAYAFEAGWKFARLVPRTDELKKIAGEPRVLGLWVYGDGSGNRLRLRIMDSTGQTFQPGGEKVDWRGWRYVEIPTAAFSHSDHWGGANDGTVHYPIRWDTLLLVDSSRNQKTQG
ncbi:MAG: hypothetical protein NT049_18455, partial [Planctomycetota bacterium]|nr:hypothetical protein [Planctomycetota bacterium]